MSPEDATLREVSRRRRADASWLYLSEALRQKVDSWLPGCAERTRTLLLSGYRASVLQDEKSSGDGRWGWLHDNVNVLSATELYT